MEKIRAIENSDKLCWKCLKEQERIHTMEFGPLGYGSGFDCCSTKIQLCDACYNESNPETWSEKLVYDSTEDEEHDWCHLADRYDKTISLRNVEPQIANACRNDLIHIAKKGLLKIVHCPIQSNDTNVLSAMNRDIKGTLEFIDFAQDLRSMGVIVATNIIIDYTVDGEVIHNMDEDWLDSHFDYWSWNPYFDGNWDYEKAKERFEKYIG